MGTFIKINATEYPAEINGRLKNPAWDGRDTKEIVLTIDYATAAALFVDGLAWAIVCRDEGQPEEEYDNSEYSMVGDITAHRDGTLSVLMGKPLEVELQAQRIQELEQAGGGDSTIKADLEAAYQEGVESNG